MGLARLLTDAHRLRGELIACRSALADELGAAEALGGALRDATIDVALSWSRSWAGWHASMYFRDYGEPGLGDAFNGEWGEFGAGWVMRSADDVQAVIEGRAGGTVAHLQSVTEGILKQARPVRRSLVSTLLPICDHLHFDREATDVQALSDAKWVIAPASFLQMLVPSQVVSRDSQAIHQGIGTPPHLAVETLIASDQASIRAVSDFIDQGIEVTDRVLNRAELHRDEVREVAPRELIESTTRLERKFAIASRAAVGAVAAVIVVLCAGLIATGIVTGLAAAALIVVSVLSIAGAWAWLINHRHVARVLGVLSAIAGAIAVVDQLLNSI